MNSKATDAVREALRYLGVPYIWGGKNPATGLDCSGLACVALEAVGVLPKGARLTTNAQALANKWPKVTDPKPGDLAFYGRGWNAVNHVTMVTETIPPGAAKVISASNGGAWCISREVALSAIPPAIVRLWAGATYRRDFLGFCRPPY